MKLSQIEKRIPPQTLTNSKDIIQTDREYARRSSRARSTRGQENEAWALYKKFHPGSPEVTFLGKDFYQVFFQQGRVALGKWCIGPQKGHLRTPWVEFFVQCPGLIFLAALWSGPAASASIFSVCLDYILRVCLSLWDSFLYLGKFHWFLYLLLSYFYDPGMFIFRCNSNFVEKVVLNESMSAKMASRVSYLVYYYCI